MPSPASHLREGVAALFETWGESVFFLPRGVEEDARLVIAIVERDIERRPEDARGRELAWEFHLRDDYAKGCATPHERDVIVAPITGRPWQESDPDTFEDLDAFREAVETVTMRHASTVEDRADGITVVRHRR